MELTNIEKLYIKYQALVVAFSDKDFYSTINKEQRQSLLKEEAYALIYSVYDYVNEENLSLTHWQSVAHALRAIDDYKLAVSFLDPIFNRV